MYSHSGTFQSAIFLHSSRKLFFLSNWKTIELFVSHQNDFLTVKKIFCCVQSLAIEADATASHRDPTCQLK